MLDGPWLPLEEMELALSLEQHPSQQFLDIFGCFVKETFSMSYVMIGGYLRTIL